MSGVATDLSGRGRRPRSAALWFGALLLARAAGAEAVGADALAALAAAEAVTPAGRLTLTVHERRGEYRAGESRAAMRARIGGEKATEAEGRFVFGEGGWMRELAVGAGTVRTRTQAAQSGGVLRFLLRAEGGPETAPAQAQVRRAASVAPADAVLSRSVAKAAQGVRWEASSREDGLLTLTGRRGEERHELVLTGDAKPAVRRWNLTRRLTAPGGESFEQQYACEVTPGEAGGIARVEEWVVNPPPVAGVSQRVTEVRKAEALARLDPAELAVPFPVGTLVLDARGEVPVEYEQAPGGIDEGAVAEVARDKARDRVVPGQPAPSFEWTEAGGKSRKLEDYRGRVVLLFWFAAWSGASERAAPELEALDRELRSKGVQVLALNVGEEGDAAGKAEAFRKRFRWAFPVLRDVDGEAMRRYGLVTGVPKAAVVDRSGSLTYVQAGWDREAVLTAVRRLLAAAK